MSFPASRPATLGQLRTAIDSGQIKRRSVKDEIRENLIARLQSGVTLFPGIIGFDDTVVPQIVNAILSRHNFILLGLRGQAKSRILRALTDLLDEIVAVIPDARSTTIRWPRSAPRAARAPGTRAISCPLRGCRARRGTSRSWRRRT